MVAPRLSAKPTGFTLIELIVVLAIFSASIDAFDTNAINAFCTSANDAINTF